MAKTALALLLMIAAGNACYLCVGTDNEDKGWVNGFFDGIQLNPAFPSACLRKMAEVDDDFFSMVKNFGDIFKFGELSLYFDSVSDFANLANDIDTSISICQLIMITSQLENLFTTEMLSIITVRVSSKPEALIKYWRGFVNEFNTNPYESGYNFGKFFSIIFDYSI
jgi:hypothetical protein